MVEYTCKKCGETFNKKSNYDVHMNRKKPCDKIVDPELKCKHCSKKYGRKDTLNRHIKNKHTNIINKPVDVNNNNNNANANNANINNANTNIVGDHNINNSHNVINQYFVLPFGKYNLDDLTISEKIDIFSSKGNPIEMIIIKTHLNSDKKQYHNCGITDIHSGYGIINDGDEWQAWRISDIMNTLIELGEENTNKLYEEIKKFFMDDAQKSIEHGLDNNKYLLRPRNNCFDIKSKKNLTAYLKSNFYNKRNIVKDAIKLTGKNPIKQINDDVPINFLREGVTIEDIENYFKEKKPDPRIANLQQMCYHLLKLIDDMDKIEETKIINYIKINNNIDEFNSIIKLLSDHYFFGKQMTYRLLLDKIKLNNAINNFIK